MLGWPSAVYLPVLRPVNNVHTAKGELQARIKDAVQQLTGLNVLQVKDQSRLTRVSYQKSWFAFKDKAGGGHLIWLGIHQMDQISFITGDEVERPDALVVG